MPCHPWLTHGCVIGLRCTCAETRRTARLALAHSAMFASILSRAEGGTVSVVHVVCVARTTRCLLAVAARKGDSRGRGRNVSGTPRTARALRTRFQT